MNYLSLSNLAHHLALSHKDHALISLIKVVTGQLRSFPSFLTQSNGFNCLGYVSHMWELKLFQFDFKMLLFYS